MRNLGITLGAAAAAISISSAANADLIFSGSGIDASDKSAISASVDFALSGNLLTISLTNTHTAISQASVLTNLAFSAPTLAGTLPGTSGSAALGALSSLVAAKGTTIDSHSIGQEWSYVTGKGIASSGFGVGTGSANLCGSKNCGDMLDGSAFGIVGTGTDLTLDGMKSRTYIENTVVISVTLPPGSQFDLSDISSVTFQYGTETGEGSIIVNGCTGGSACDITPPGGGGGGGRASVPEPGTLGLLGVGLLGLGYTARRRRS